MGHNLSPPLAKLPSSAAQKDPDHSVALRSESDKRVIRASNGPGLSIHKAFLYAGLHVEEGLHRLAHKCGLGPVAVTNRIEGIFVDNKLLKLDELHCVLNPTPVGVDREGHPNRNWNKAPTYRN